MKTINFVAWCSAGCGVVMILLGIISGVLARSIISGVVHIVNYFLISDSFFLLATALFVYLLRYQTRKD
jgi:hypothetical protein